MSIQKKKVCGACVQIGFLKIMSYRVAIILLSLNIMTGCASLETALVPESVSEPNPNDEILQLQSEVKQLQELIAKKDALIHVQSVRQQKSQRKQVVHQQKQAETQQTISNEVTRVQVKLHRLATKPSAASKIAEAEVAMESLKQNPAPESDQVLQIHAQRLLDAASEFYGFDNYVVAMNYAAQAHEFIDMVADKKRKLPYPSQEIVPIHTPVMLGAVTDINLRKEPQNNSIVLNILKKGSVFIMHAYQGNWLQVQTDGGRQGWVLSTLVETVVSGR